MRAGVLCLLLRAVEAEWYPYNATEWATAVSNSHAMCINGTEQSPIDFPSCSSPPSRAVPTITWKNQTVELLNNGHTVQLNALGSDNTTGKMSFEIGGHMKEYTLMQCHFHWGSEHTVGGQQFPFEAHCVHSLDGSDLQRFGVFGVFYEVGSTSSDFLGMFEADLPSYSSSRRLTADDLSFDLLGNPMDTTTKRRLANTPTVSAYSGPLDFKALYRGIDLSLYWNYEGSFTTPPCTEAVDFYIFMQKAVMSQSQLDTFKTAIGWHAASGNFRPPQELHSRSIYGCTELPPFLPNNAWYPYNARNWDYGVGALSNSLCRFGSMQSPIDFAMCKTPDDRLPILVTWEEQPVELYNNGHTIQLDALGSSTGQMAVNGKIYTLVQCHFHYGSEHTVSSQQYPFEVHCVHLQSGTEEAVHYGVFGLFYEVGATTNPFLATLEDKLPALPHTEVQRRLTSSEISFDLFGNPMDVTSKRKLAGTKVKSDYTGPVVFSDLYGDNSLGHYWNYEGSFTTPPCTEAVDFYIMMEPAVMTAAQLQKFQRAIGWAEAGGNFRPPQPLNGRVVSGCSESVPPSSHWYPYAHDNWATKVPVGANHKCADGVEQSPIDFPACGNPKRRPPPSITWTMQYVQLINNGHTIQLTAMGPYPGKMQYEIGGINKTYTLVQCHFHWGSEHTLAGVQAPFEAHCVHTLDGSDSDQRYGVFGVFYEVGSTDNEFLARFEGHLPTHESAAAHRRLTAADVSFDLFGNAMDSQTKRRLAASSNVSTWSGPLNFRELYDSVSLDTYWNYDGSFTTPPCTEAVDFYIFMEKAMISQRQLDTFQAAIGWSAAGGNFRPPQALNTRTIYGCDRIPSTQGDHAWYPYQASNWAQGVGLNSNMACRYGSEQSPIDFQMCQVPQDRDPIQITWQVQPVELLNNGHTVQLTAKGDTKGQMEVNNKTYTLHQCHFHWVSEHTVSTKTYPFEAHCVHIQDGTEEASHYGVFGLFFELGANANPFLDTFVDQLPTHVSGEGHRRLAVPEASFDVFGNPMDTSTKRRLAGAAPNVSSFEGPVDFQKLYGDDSLTHYWNYEGSFTTPPCTEAVDFYIMMQPAVMTNAQLHKFKHAIGWMEAGGNFRPPQPLNARVVAGCATSVPESTAWYPYSHSNWATSASGANHLCKDGVEQSPIDFPACSAPQDRQPPTIDWGSQNVRLLNNGHTVQIDALGAQPGKMSYTLSGFMKVYTLLQCHFHWESEHSVAGSLYPLEVHCVHTLDGSDTQQRYGVFGMFYEVGSTENSFLKLFEDDLPTQASQRRLSVANRSFDLFGNPMDVQTKRRLAAAPTVSAFNGPLDFDQLYSGLDLAQYWNYDGSFTTPPCTEAVDFYIYMNTVTLTQGQLDKFKNAIGWSAAGGNFRPTQPLNTRTIYGCDVLPKAPDSKPWYPYIAHTWAAAVGINSNTACRYGSEQSPIDFQMCRVPEERDPIQLTWQEQPVELLNNGHTVQLTAKGSPTGKMAANAKNYTLIQCHFHWVSEHTVSTKPYPFEAHCVHLQDGTGEAPHYGVFGIFFELGESANPFLDTFIDELPTHASGAGHRRLAASQASFDVFGTPLDAITKRRLAGAVPNVSSFQGPINFKQLYGGNSLTHYWNYEGSFTTPPCTEAVDFYIMMDPAIMTAAQLDKFKHAIGWMEAGGNFRPPQPLNSRVVAGCAKPAHDTTRWYPYAHSNWANYVPGANHLCRDGVEQSPINFPACNDPVLRPAPTITWGSQSIQLLNNGHTVQLDALGTQPGKMTYYIGGINRTYTLVQCHFHWGSEHTVAGAQYPFEAHCVHTLDGSDSAQRYGVFGVFYEVGGTENSFLKLFENHLPAHEDAAHRRLSAAAVSFNLWGHPLEMQTKRRLAAVASVSAFNGPLDFDQLHSGLDLSHYWNYDGSFTTPPCTEAVDFYIYMDKATLTQGQLNKFKDAIGWNSMGGNYRPPQALNTRTIYGCDRIPSITGDLAWYPYNARAWEKAVGVNSHGLCKYGAEQSPIDFPMCQTPQEHAPIRITWKDQSVELINNGHTVQLTATGASKGKMQVDGKSYTLVQCHFHWGSEHTISTKQYPFEAHCVHTQDGTEEAPHYGVFGLFFELGQSAHPFLSSFEDYLPSIPQSSTNRRLTSSDVSFDVFGNPMDMNTKRRLAGGVQVSNFTGPVNFPQLFGDDDLTRFWSYGGSFTTPPCTEAVDFNILMKPAIMTQVQLDKFKTAIGWLEAKGNFRPPQPLMGRTIGGCAKVVPETQLWYPYAHSNWASQVSSANPSCKEGTMQSPINFPACSAPSARPPPFISWKTQHADLSNNCHTVQLAPSRDEEQPGKMSFDISGIVKDYTLVQCHFHWQSEHTVASTHSPFEVHCVHVLDSVHTAQRFGVFGMFYEVGADANEFLSQFEDMLPSCEHEGRRLASEEVSFNIFGDPMDARTKRRLYGTGSVRRKIGPINFRQLYKDLNLTEYWNYDGSFTTPPCTEAVDFYIFMQKATLTQAQLDKFKAAIGWEDAGGNFRPPQPLNTRTVYGCGTLPPALMNQPWYPYDPDVWAGRVGASSNEVCKDGAKQSPIDFVSCINPATRDRIKTTWKNQQANLVNTGHAIQIDALDPMPGKMMVGTKNYTLLQCHFHWGSEHTEGGLQYPFEAHCVHRMDGTEEAPYYGVFGVFYRVTDVANPFLSTLEESLPSLEDRRLASTDVAFNIFGAALDSKSGRRLAGTTRSVPVTLNFQQLYGQLSLSLYWSYEGSFTTPPCTEAVDFYILMQSATMSQAQLDTFKNAIGWNTAKGNYRPPQPLGSRTVYGCEQPQVAQPETKIEGSLTMEVADADAFISSRSVRDAMEKGIAQIAGVPDHYVSATLRKAPTTERRLNLGPTRRLNVGTVIVNYVISIPASRLVAEPTLAASIASSLDAADETEISAAITTALKAADVDVPIVVLGKTQTEAQGPEDTESEASGTVQLGCKLGFLGLIVRSLAR